MRFEAATRRRILSIVALGIEDIQIRRQPIRQLLQVGSEDLLVHTGPRDVLLDLLEEVGDTQSDLFTVVDLPCELRVLCCITIAWTY